MLARLTLNTLALAVGAAFLAGSALAQQTAAPTAQHHHHQAAASTIEVEAAWARPTVEGQQVGGGFLTLKNTGPGADKLIGGSTPVAERLELHMMRMDGNVMRMDEVPAIELPAGQSVEFKPGGYHLMFRGLKAPLKLGSSVPVTLKFEKAGELKLQMKVLRAPAAHMHEDAGQQHEHH
ncbi:MAG TPA: copper chaperone PCu(A)C [Methylibium sp.]